MSVGFGTEAQDEDLYDTPGADLLTELAHNWPTRGPLAPISHQVLPRR